MGALGIESLLLLLAGFFLVHQVQQPLHRDVVQMMLVPAPPRVSPPKPVPPRPKPVVHKATPKPVPKPVPKPTPHPVIRHRPVHHVVRHHPVVHKPAVKKLLPHQIPKKITRPVVHAVAKSAPKAIHPVPPQYRDIVREAVQHAVVYPLAARIAQITGRARVSFDFSQGRVSNEKIIVSSNAAVLDQAALAAILRAHIPTPPPDLSGRILHFVIWVRFYMVHS